MFSPNRPCKKSVTTSTGKFTFFDDYVTYCEAERRCKKRGEVLAPYTNKKDVRKVMKFLRSQNDIEGCLVCTYNPAKYWVGLDVSYTERDQSKVFSNGVQWNGKKHGKIYKDFNTEYTDCAVALFEPIDPNNLFYISRESPTCSWRKRNYYACFKPVGDASADPIVQDQDDFDDEIVLSSGTIGAVTILVFAIGTIVGVLARDRYQKRKEKRKKLEIQSGNVVKNSCVNGDQ